MANRFALVDNMIERMAAKEIVAGNERVVRRRGFGCQVFLRTRNRTHPWESGSKAQSIVFHASRHAGG